MAEAANPIVSRDDAVKWLREKGTIDEKGKKFTLSKPNTREFLALSGAPEPVQTSYLNSLKLLDAGMSTIAADELRRIAAEEKKSGVAKEDASPFVAVALNDHFNICTKAAPWRQTRSPKTGEKKDQYGSVRTTYGVKKDPDIKAIAQELSKDIEKVFAS